MNESRGFKTHRADDFVNNNKQIRSKMAKHDYDKATKGRPFMQASRNRNY